MAFEHLEVVFGKVVPDDAKMKATSAMLAPRQPPALESAPAAPGAANTSRLRGHKYGRIERSNGATGRFSLMQLRALGPSRRLG